MAEEKREEIRVKRISMRESPMLLLFRIITVDIIFLSVWISLNALFTLLIEDGSGSLFAEVIFSNVVLGLILVLITIWVVLQWRNHYYIIFPSAIVEKNGVFFTTERSFACNRIESVDVTQSFLGRLLDYGTVALYDPFLEKHIYLNDVSTPKIYANVLKDIYVKGKQGVYTTTADDKVLINN